MENCSWIQTFVDLLDIQKKVFATPRDCRNFIGILWKIAFYRFSNSSSFLALLPVVIPTVSTIFRP